MNNISDDIILSPCPFCGAEASRNFDVPDNGGSIYISCSSCGTNGPSSYYKICTKNIGKIGEWENIKWKLKPEGQQEKDAIDGWNNRSAAMRNIVLEEAAKICEQMVVGGRAWNKEQELAADVLFACAKNIRAIKCEEKII